MGFQVGDIVQGGLSKIEGRVEEIDEATGRIHVVPLYEPKRNGWSYWMSPEIFLPVERRVGVRMTFEIGDHTRRTDGVNDKIYKVVGISSNRKHLWLEPGIGNGIPCVAPADVHERVVEKTRTVTEWVKAP